MVLFFDIDGTLVDNASQVLPESTVRAIGALRSAGHVAIVNTGRPYSHIDPRVRALPCAGWVCSCGMEIRLEEKWLLRRDLGREMSRWVMEQVRKFNMQVIYEIEGGFLLDGEYSSLERIGRECRKLEGFGCSVWQTRDMEAPVIIKFVTFDGPNSRHPEFIAAMEPYFTCMERGKTMVEYVLKDYSKAAGMALVMQQLGVDPADSLAFGDSTNDISMFRAAGKGICMGDGMEEAKANAHYVTDTVLGDGIEKALIHFGLI